MVWNQKKSSTIWRGYFLSIGVSISPTEFASTHYSIRLNIFNLDWVGFANSFTKPKPNQLDKKWVDLSQVNWIQLWKIYFKIAEKIVFQSHQNTQWHWSAKIILKKSITSTSQITKFTGSKSKTILTNHLSWFGSSSGQSWSRGKNPPILATGQVSSLNYPNPGTDRPIRFSSWL